MSPRKNGLTLFTVDFLRAFEMGTLFIAARFRTAKVIPLRIPTKVTSQL